MKWLLFTLQVSENEKLEHQVKDLSGKLQKAELVTQQVISTGIIFDYSVSLVYQTVVIYNI